MRGESRPRAWVSHRLRTGIAATVAAASLGACELKEVAIVEVEDVVIAEVYIQIGDGTVTDSRALAFLHRTVGGQGPGFHPVPGARVVVTRARGTSFEFAATGLETCATALPIEGDGSCYWLAPGTAELFQPGDELELVVELPDGSRLTSATRVPDDFSLVALDGRTPCVLPPETPLEVRWGRSAGAWAYINETEIWGLRAALEARGITVDDDPLELLGLSVSAQDTSIVFPGEFGVFNRFELDQGLATALQRGLPEGTTAAVTISAADRNYVNWVRGGNFNPSGQVRVPSLLGSGTGVFAATVTRSFRVVVNPDPDGGVYEGPACPVS